MTTSAPTVAVIGAGSIGARHARNLAAAGARVLVCDPDGARAEAAASAAADHAPTAPPPSAVAFDLAALADHGLQGAVVASPTSLHVEQASALVAADASLRLLVEKPIGTDPATAAHLAAHADRVAVAYNLRFHQPLVRAAELAASGELGEVHGIDLWFGSWLPDWRPTVDYRTTYSAQARLGGGILLDAIHELDVLVWLAGPGPHEVLGAACQTSGLLELDVEDDVRALVRCADGALATISLDYLARRYRRGVQLTGSAATLRLDWARGVLEVETADQVRTEPADVALDRAYEAQAEAFVAWLDDGPALPVDAATGLASLELADAIRRAAR